jgi:hypothetical protein
VEFAARQFYNIERFHTNTISGHHHEDFKRMGEEKNGVAGTGKKKTQRAFRQLPEAKLRQFLAERYEEIVDLREMRTESTLAH